MGMTIIKNYRMPYNCYDCALHNYHYCDLTGESIEEDYCYNGDSREKHCPLREVEAIPKDQYEARLKVDMIAMLTDIQLEMEESVEGYEALDDFQLANINGRIGENNKCRKIIQQKIDKLKEAD